MGSAEHNTTKNTTVMDLTNNICVFCCTVHTKSSLAQITVGQEQFLQQFLCQKESNDTVKTLLICHSCNTKLDNFKQFWEQFRNNLTMMKIIRSEQENRNKLEQSEHARRMKTDTNCTQDFTVKFQHAKKMIHNKTYFEGNDVTPRKDDKITDDNIVTHNKVEEEKMNDSKLAKLYCYRLNDITIEKSFAYLDAVAIHNNITTDVSTDMDTNVTFVNDDNYEVLEEPVSPPPTTDLVSSVLSTSGDPILIPRMAITALDKLESDSELNSKHHQDHGFSSSDERRRQRNREASRRYRERARDNPELLKKMREQQNARQKKYYARLRFKKQNSFNGNHSLLEEEKLLSF